MLFLPKAPLPERDQQRDTGATWVASLRYSGKIGRGRGTDVGNHEQLLTIRHAEPSMCPDGRLPAMVAARMGTRWSLIKALLVLPA